MRGAPVPNWLLLEGVLRVWPPWNVDLVEKLRGNGVVEGVFAGRGVGVRGLTVLLPPLVLLLPLLLPPLAPSGREGLSSPLAS